ncbi:hypothetical protein Thiosp_01002 [Thiorhodovibrio litoralis]|nr:hypothetical protein Thiosp_01002 [Thiorhodovibrio litoralis]
MPPPAVTLTDPPAFGLDAGPPAGADPTAGTRVSEAD